MADSDNTRTLPTRRAVLLGAGAALVTGITAAGAAVPLDADMTRPLVADDDAELLELEREWLAPQPEIRRLDDAYGVAMEAAIDRIGDRSIDANVDLFRQFIRDAGYSDADSARHDALQDRTCEIESRLMEMPAHGAAGLAVKLRMLARNSWQRVPSPGGLILDIPFDDLDWPHKWTVLILREAERMAGEVQS
ncbi:hypothetical protein ABIE65_004977 [Constrictibacter sp. MBR-5]|jgi:hypothetical protein|uniref:hypothetical protein n=1 Tax=Constrictibacter sp. MBR-5 TaxID=3156467 RepID=UPI00339AE123